MQVQPSKDLIHVLMMILVHINQLADYQRTICDFIQTTTCYVNMRIVAYAISRTFKDAK